METVSLGTLTGKLLLSIKVFPGVLPKIFQKTLETSLGSYLVQGPESKSKMEQTKED